MSKTAVVLAVMAMLGGCSREENRKQETGDGKQETGNRRLESGQIDGRSQRELAKEIGAAEKMRRDEVDGEYGRIRKDWLGKRVSWQLDVVPALCRSADACHALAFDRLGADRAIVQGWMPRLRLDDAAFAALEARCRGLARCPVTVQATVAEFTLSADEPTSLTLADVAIGG